MHVLVVVLCAAINYVSMNPNIAAAVSSATAAALQKTVCWLVLHILQHGSGLCYCNGTVRRLLVSL
jgi:hypothetical protein